MIFQFFKVKHGGRGATTFFGASIALVGIKFFFPLFLIWLLILSLTKMTGLTNFIFPWVFQFSFTFGTKLVFFLLNISSLEFWKRF